MSGAGPGGGGPKPAAGGAEADLAALKARILAEPEIVLDDGAVMAALIGAGESGARNVVDLRGALVSRLESRLEQLSRAHRSVIAAAYENLAGAAQIHRATLMLLEQETLEGYLRALLLEAPQILALDVARLCLEGEADPAPEAAGLPPHLAARVVALPPLGVEAYTALGDAPGREGVWLRATPEEADVVYGDEAGTARSEALLTLDLDGRRGLLAFASEDPARFSPEHGSDLVEFFGGVVARSLPRLLPGA